MNNMHDIWGEIVGTLKPYFENCMEVGDYQREVEFCLRYLGWKRTDGNVSSQLVIPLGGGYSLRPDIYLQKNELQLPIEVKLPNSIKQMENLSSYMNSLKSNIGLFVGKNIQLYYRNHEEESEIVPIMAVEIDESDTKGEVLCELLQFNDCSLNGLYDFCKSYKVNPYNESLNMRLRNFLSPERIEDNIRSLIVEKFVSEGFDKEFVSEELSKLPLNLKCQVTCGDLKRAKYDESLEDEEDKDNTGYKLEKWERYYGKGPFVLEVIKQYVKDNPNITYYELEKQFPSEIIAKRGKHGVVRKIEWAEAQRAKSRDGKLRYFNRKSKKGNDIIRLKDGTRVVVSTEWGKGDRMNRFLQITRKLYGKIQTIPDWRFHDLNIIE